MKFDSLTRLRALRDRKEAALAANRSASDRVREVRAKLLDKRNERRRIAEQYQPRDAEDRLKELDGRIAALEEEVEAAEAASERASAAFQSAAAVYESALDFARENDLPIPDGEERNVEWGMA